MATPNQRKMIVAAVQGVLVIAIAALVAMGVNAMLGRQLATTTWAGEGPVMSGGGEVERASGGQAGQAMNALRYNRNLFDQDAVGDEPPVPSGGDGEAAGGETGAEPEIRVAQHDGPGESDLKHTLLGTMVAQPASASVAHVRTAQGEDVYVHPGETLPSCRVLKVGREYILVERTDRPGQVEYLSLYGTAGSAGQRNFSSKATNERRAAMAAAQARNVKPTIAPGAARLRPGRGALKAPPGMVRIEGEAVAINPEVVQRQNAAGAELSQSLGLKPMSRGGNVIGMRVGSVEDGSVMAEIGLGEGDVIRSVNGQPATDDGIAGSFMHTLETEGEVTVEVDRRGKVETLTLRAK